MKRELFQNIKVQPYTSGSALERAGFLSLVLGAAIGAAGDLTVTVTDSDDGSAFEEPDDEKVFPGEASSKNGVLTLAGLAKDDVADIDIDLVGLKNYVKIAVSGTAASGTTLAVALGDAAVQPV
ncbi:MAG: hypothetical protein IJ799_02980 [Bacteroidales bacterium]|nr:hypothetical protein [Bacteroidales bacterium]